MRSRWMPARGSRHRQAAHTVWCMEDAERYCRTFVQTWAEAVARQVKRVRETRDNAARAGRAYERMGPELGPDELDLARYARQQWADEQALVWAAHQLERWTRRLALERDEEPAPRDRVLADLRNALEHLDEADFEGRAAVPGERSRSLAALPGGRLSLLSRGGPAFGLIEVGELERRALALVDAVEEELMEEAAEWWSEMRSGR
jgi:hypothetical protein